MITYKDIEILEKIKEDIRNHKNNNTNIDLSKEILSAKIIDTPKSTTFKFDNTQDSNEQRNRMIVYLDNFIKRNPEYSYEYNVTTGSNGGYITFTIRKEDGVTKTDNTIN